MATAEFIGVKAIQSKSKLNISEIMHYSEKYVFSFTCFGEIYMSLLELISIAVAVPYFYIARAHCTSSSVCGKNGAHSVVYQVFCEINHFAYMSPTASER